jgi:hypothetical protein
LPDERLKGDGARESEAVVLCAGDVAEDALGLLPVATGWRTHVATEKNDRG